MPPKSRIAAGFVVAVVGFFSSFPIVLQGLAVMGAHAAQAALADPAGREAAVVTLLITASGISLYDISAPVWGLLIGGAVYLIRRRGWVS